MKHALTVLLFICSLALLVIGLVMCWQASGLYHIDNDEMVTTDAYKKGVESVCGPLRRDNYNLSTFYCD